MPVVQRKNPDMPKGSHLALLTGVNQYLPIEPGAQFNLVESADSPNRIFPMVLKSVRHDRLVFVLGETEYVYRLQGAKPLSREAARRMAANRGEK